VGPRWKTLRYSAIGSSHERDALPCQDSSEVHLTQDGEKQFLVLVCADGAGSASHAEIGSQLACTTYCDSVEKLLLDRDGEQLFTREGQLSLFVRVRAALVSKAAELEVSVRELACTLLTAIVGPDSASLTQLGDGAIVIGAENAYHCAFWPDGGEYANQTNFLSEEDFGKHLLFSRLDERVDEIALMTDGLQRLALNFESRDAHSPFFAGFFSALRGAEQPDELYPDFITFLKSPKVNSRTDDDKTLILATRRQ